MLLSVILLHMNWMRNQFEEIIDIEKIDNLSETELKNKIMQELNYHKYTTKKSNLNPSNSSLHNPAIDFYLSVCDWSEDGWVEKNTSEYDNHNLYFYPAEYIPSDEIINYLTNLNEILEIGAGNGYWTYVINENGGNCLATDVYPRKAKKNNFSYPVTNFSLNNSETVWTEVKEKSHECINQYPNSDILLCHPEGMPWTEEIIELMNENQKLILIASWFPGPDSTPLFFKKLVDNWTLLKQLQVYKFKHSHAQMYVFEKN